MRIITFGCLSLLLLKCCPAPTQETLSPKHIETPGFPPLARAARLMGKVALAVTIDADGNVKSVEAVKNNTESKANPLLEQAATQNIQKWTFSKPSHTPFTQTIVYDYEFDEHLPPTGDNPIEKVDFDLPDRVTVVSNHALVEP